MELMFPVTCLFAIICVVCGSSLHLEENDALSEISNPFLLRQKRAASSCYSGKCGSSRPVSGSQRTSYSGPRRSNYNRCNTGYCRNQAYGRPPASSSYSSASSSSFSQGNGFGYGGASAGSFNPAAFFNSLSGGGGYGVNTRLNCLGNNCAWNSGYGNIPPQFFNGFDVPPGFNFPQFPNPNGFGIGSYYFPPVPQFSPPPLCTGHGCSGRSVSVRTGIRSSPGSRGKGVWAASSIASQDGKVTSYRTGTGRL